MNHIAFRIKILSIAIVYAFASGMIAAGTNSLYTYNFPVSDQASDYFMSPLVANLNGKLPSTETIDFGASQFPTVLKKGKELFARLDDELLAFTLNTKQRNVYHQAASLWIKFPVSDIIFPFHNFW